MTAQTPPTNISSLATELLDEMCGHLKDTQDFIRL
jgi:hypothetical protein